MSKKRWLYLAVAVVCTLGLVVVGCAKKPAAKGIKTYRLGTSAEGSFGYEIGVGMAKVIKDHAKTINITATPTPGSTASNKLLNTGELDFSYANAITLQQAYTNKGPFAKEPVTWRAYQTVYTYTADWMIMVPKDSPIKCYKDLVGKKVFPMKAGTGIYDVYEIVLKKLGYWDKIERKQVSMMGAADALKLGTIDAAGCYTVAAGVVIPSWIRNIDARMDCRVLEPTSEEKAIIEKAKIPGVMISEVPKKCFSKDVVPGKEAIWTYSVPYGYHASPAVDADRVYEFTKIFWEYPDELIAMNPGFGQLKGGKEFAAKSMGAMSELVPVHPGAAKYYKEMGIWKDSWKVGEPKPSPFK